MTNFTRQHHQRIEHILRRLNAGLLVANKVGFGGGTAIALRNDEYRVSVDIDLMVSDIDGYRAIKTLVGRGEIGNLFKEPVDFDFRMSDQYAIRSFVFNEATQIKLEIVFDAYVPLNYAPESDWICGVPTLSNTSLIAEKLLANADRWADSSMFSRDLLDLAIMRKNAGELARGLELATNAYKSGVLDSALKAIEALISTPGRLARCRDALSIDTLNLIDLTIALQQLRAALASND